jgi:hypothetical protein
MYGYLRWKGIEIIKLSHLQEAFLFTKSRIQTLLKR